ncbi:unnamed protein product (macronuclear) [Paramecium tetraurelia]|uniref:Cilia- and flagella-associated protein 36 n=1 Tax=Paramecium tetraurelia TaxID=5888 RepID=A0E4T4_PARTE|nr:uncharacterized protein GSPATT00023476001 [Paramecium tetraurelia]CAK90301.1 unnamed protein product [Paramecium tetraurelia]|eukprot:XP_001457698.1 hypothetical protein (macronuclear) [Paramecium tetraurelia strain d4-2]
MGFFDYFFGKKKEPEKQAPQPQAVVQQPKSNKQIEEENWVYASILQYLTSPIWNITISEFVDQNCIVFDDEEENKLEYQALFKKYKKMMANLIDNMMNELGVNEEQFAEQVEKGLRHPKEKLVFEKLLTIDNFLVFKTQMIKRNKELELEALKEIEKQDQKKVQKGQVVNPQNNANIKLLEMEAEKAELEHALQMSLAVEEEKKKMVTEEDRQLQEVLRQSLVEFQQGLKKQREALELKTRELKKAKEEQAQKAQEFEQQSKLQQQQQQQPQQQLQQQQPSQEIKQQGSLNSDGTPTPILKSEYQLQNIQSQIQQGPTMAEFYQVQNSNNSQPEKVEQVQNQKEPIPILQSKKLDKLSHKPVLPSIQGQAQPVIQQADSVIQFEMDVAEDDAGVKKSVIANLASQKTTEINNVDQGESVEDRKRRLIKQREEIRKRKEEENKKTLEQYKQQQANEINNNKEDDAFSIQRKNTQEELQRKRELLEKKKNEIKLQKEKMEKEKMQNQEEDIDLL